MGLYKRYQVTCQPVNFPLRIAKLSIRIVQSLLDFLPENAEGHSTDGYGQEASPEEAVQGEATGASAGAPGN